MVGMWKRAYGIGRTQDERCTATVVLSDKSLAQCQRWRKVGTLCKQHAAKAGK